jgi:hypothetical protein
MHVIVPSACVALSLAVAAVSAVTPSPYAGQEAREIKSLSSSEQADLLAGKGMGLAKAAELNGYPGPAHVLQLAAELALSAEQRARTEALFAAMEQRAQTLGRRLVDEERALDALFASRQITPQRLSESLDRIGALQAQVRAAHLDAHLEQVRILSDEQTRRYMALRGYGEHGGHGEHGGTQRHRH